MAHLTITAAAADQIRRVLEERGAGLGLRVSVKPSGCSGYSYVLDFADEAEGDDTCFEEHGVKVFVAPEALEMLDGSEVDYVENMMGGGFSVNASAASTAPTSRTSAAAARASRSKPQGRRSSASQSATIVQRPSGAV